ncbi:MAG: metallophosphoesterase [Candidatus Nezhaarchaeota archaeon]|nr:metallophosphoesterase [Candidatus Nezhaarchaeota archaeon]
MLEPVVGAVSDVHSPKFFEDFKRVLNNSPDLELMLLVGDMIYKGDVNEYQNIIDAIKKRYGNCKIVACFGNEEYDDKTLEISTRYREVVWLNDESIALQLCGLKIILIGTKGCLDRPTSWQRRHIPRIEQVYEERLKKIDRLLLDASSQDSDIVMLLSHYSTTFKTLTGEPKWAWPELGSAKLEEVVKRRKPDIVIHGHAHNSKTHTTTINGTCVYNVSFPATRKITTIRLKVRERHKKEGRQATLTSFMEGNP